MSSDDLEWVKAAFLLSDKLHDGLAKLVAMGFIDPHVYDAGECSRCHSDHHQDLTALMKAARRDALVIAAMLDKDASAVNFLVEESPT